MNLSLCFSFALCFCRKNVIFDVLLESTRHHTAVIHWELGEVKTRLRHAETNHEGLEERDGSRGTTSALERNTRKPKSTASFIGEQEN